MGKLTKDELDVDLCKYCDRTDYGEIMVNTGPHNMCDGSHCDEAYNNYLDSEEDE